LWRGLETLWVTSGNRTTAHIEGLDALVAGAPDTTLAIQSSPPVVNFHFVLTRLRI